LKSPAMKCFALIGIVLFLGIAVAPSINAGVVKDAIEKKVKERKENIIHKIESVKSNTNERFQLNNATKIILIIILRIISLVSLKTYELIGLIYTIFWIAFEEIFGYWGGYLGIFIAWLILCPILIPIDIFFMFLITFFNVIHIMAEDLIVIIQWYQLRNKVMNMNKSFSSRIEYKVEVV